MDVISFYSKKFTERNKIVKIDIVFHQIVLKLLSHVERYHPGYYHVVRQMSVFIVVC